MNAPASGSSPIPPASADDLAVCDHLDRSALGDLRTFVDATLVALLAKYGRPEFAGERRRSA